MKRREFIRNTAAGSIIGGIGMQQLGSSNTVSAAPAMSGQRPLVTIAASNEASLTNPAPMDVELSYDQVRDVVFLALDRDTSPRNLRELVKKDHWVVIKTNIVRIVWLSQDGYYGLPGLAPDFERENDALALVTDLRVVKAVAEYVIEKVGPRRISIAEGPAEWYNAEGHIKPGNYVDGWHYEFPGFDGLSYVKIVEQLNGRNGTTVDIVDLNEDEGIYVTDFDPYETGTNALQFLPPDDEDASSDREPTRRKGLWMPRTVIEKDVLITVPVLKTHGTVGTTLFMKNFIGCVHSVSYDPLVTHKGVFHKGSDLNLVRGIVDLTSAINPDYGVAEGFWAVMNHHHGQKGIGFNHNIVVAGADIVAAESVANMAMGYNPLDFDILRLANMKKLGEWHPDYIDIAGPSVDSVRVNYAKAWNKYVARGVRKWKLAGPFRRPVDSPGELDPRLGQELDGEKWELMDGDEILDNDPQIERMRYKQSLPYAIPGSEDARKDSVFYLALTINGQRMGLVGQLLVGMTGGTFTPYLNGQKMSYNSAAYPYDPSPSAFITLIKGKNTLILEVQKTGDRDEPVKIAANICDLDGDRLWGITFDPDGEPRLA